MTEPPTNEPADGSPSESVSFRSVLCGVDSSPASAAAPRQGARLADDEADLWAVSVWDPKPAVHTGIHMGKALDFLRTDALKALRSVRENHPAFEEVLVRGSDVAGILRIAARVEADLVCVGSHGTSRAAGVVFGSVATAMLHYAPCSVLIAREAHDEFPRRILHCGDGSGEALEAARVAGRLAARSGGSIVTLSVSEELGPQYAGTLAAESGAAADEAGVETEIRVEEGSPHRRVVEVADELDADLVVVGSSGRSGISALGSVSERVAHRAPCSVLVVRFPTHPSEEPSDT